MPVARLPRARPANWTFAWAVLALAWCAAAAAAQEPGTSENPRRRWEHFYHQRAYPFGRIAPGALQRALGEYRARWPAQYAARAAGARTDVTAAAGPDAWTALGPAPIANLAAGRISTIAVHPTVPGVMYIGGAQGGVWRTVDGGERWIPLTDGECSLAMGSIALDPVDPDIIYAGTGELHFSGDSYYGCGLLRSTDGGASWTQLGASIFDTNSGGARVSKVIVDRPTAGSPTSTTIYMSSSFGVHRSTDSGVTWTRVLDGIATDLVVHPTQPRTLYAAIGGTGTNAANGVYRTDDGGATWVRLQAGFPTTDVGRIALAMAPSAPSVLYAAVQNAFESPRAPSDGQLLGIWRTGDGGQTWVRLAATNAACGTQCWYNLVIATHPADPETVYFGGVLIYRSLDGGTLFTNVLNGIHVDHHAIAFDPVDPTVVYSGNDGGIYRSSNGGVNWTSINGNLQITQFYSGIALHPSDPRVVLGGTQDNGTLEYGGDPAWQAVLGADGGFTAIDFANPVTAYAETQWTAGSGFSGPRRRDVTGGSFIRRVVGIDVNDNALFIPPLVMDATDPRVLYFGTYRVYRTADRGDSWTAISGNLSRTGGGVVSAIAPAPFAPATVYVGTSDGALNVTTDGGASWAVRTSGLPNRYVTDIAVDAADPLAAIVTVSGFGTGHVFRTTDGGVTWQNISGNLPDMPVNAVLAAPALGGAIFVGTDLGVFRTTDGGATWTPRAENMPNVAVFDLAMGRTTGQIVAATHGRGMFAFSAVTAATVVVAPENLSFSALGDTARLQAVATDPQGAPITDFSPGFYSENTGVASVDGTGLVRATGNGTTRIIAALTGAADTADVVVRQVVAQVTGLADTASLVQHEVRQLIARPLDANGHPVDDAVVAWSSTDAGVVATDATGRISAGSVGAATVRAQVGALADSMAIHVAAPAIVVVEAAANPAPAVPPRSTQGTRIPLLRLSFRVDGIESVIVTGLGFDGRGDDAGASLVLMRDADADGAIDPGEAELANQPIVLQPGAVTRVAMTPGFLEVPTDSTVHLVAALRMSGAAPNGTAFELSFVPEATRSVGARSGVADRIEQPAGVVTSAAVRSTVLADGARFSMSENPVRSGGVTFNFAVRPDVAAVYTVTGRRVVDLLELIDDGGSLRWDLTNADGSPVSPGVYLVVFEVQGERIREKLIVLRREQDDDARQPPRSPAPRS
jgi:photosystem II stability/assembly factor-like uncharacterized protein